MPKRTHDPHLPRGLYRHRNRFRCRAWLDPDGQLHKRRASSSWVATWFFFEESTDGAASKAFIDWRGDKSRAKTMAEGFDDYLDSQKFKKMADTTKKTEKRRVATLKAVFGKLPYRGLTNEVVADYLKEAPPQGGKKDIKRLSAIVNWWIAMGKFKTVNFIPELLKVHDVGDNARTRYVTDGELDQIMQVVTDRLADGHGARILAALIPLIVLTGRRVSDVRKIKRSDVFDVGVGFKEGKTGKRVTVGVTPALKAACENAIRLCPGSFYLIGNRDGNPTSEGSVNQAVQRMREHWNKAGIEPFQLRDLRAKYGTDLEVEGRDGAANMGHASRRTFDLHYMRLARIVESLR